MCATFQVSSSGSFREAGRHLKTPPRFRPFGAHNAVLRALLNPLYDKILRTPLQAPQMEITFAYISKLRGPKSMLTSCTRRVKHRLLSLNCSTASMLINTGKDDNYNDVLPKTSRCDSISNVTSFGASNLSCRQIQCRFIEIRHGPVGATPLISVCDGLGIGQNTEGG